MPAQSPLRLILSSVGISLLTNAMTEEERKSIPLTRWANLETLSQEQQRLVDPLEARVTAILEHANEAEIRKASAELNGIYALYDPRNNPGMDALHARSGKDIHVLVTTDTELAARCALMVCTHLERLGFTVLEPIVPRKLSMASSALFAAGMKELIAQCHELVEGYDQQHYQIIFNLVGGFKSLQSYLNTIGMFYADEIIYMFEGPEAVLIRIPRLPITIDYELLKGYTTQLALLAEAQAELPIADLGDLPAALYNETKPGHAKISDWGLLIWKRMRKNCLRSDLLGFPRLMYQDTFRREYEKIQGDEERILIQTHLAQVSYALIQGGGDLRALYALHYEPYEKAKKTTRMGHFPVTDAMRINCIPTADGLEITGYVHHDHEYLKGKVY